MLRPRSLCAFSALVTWVGSASGALADETMLETVEVHGRGRSAEVVARGEFDVPEYSVRATTGGRVVILEIAHGRLPPEGARVTGQTTLVERVSTSTTARGVRIEIASREPVSYRARSAAGRVEVRLEPQGEASEPAEAGDGGPATVRAVQLERRNGEEQVVVELSRAAAFQLVRGASRPTRLEIRDAVLAAGVERALARQSGSVVRRLVAREREGATVLEAEHASGAAVSAVREGRRIVWFFGEGSPQRVSSRSLAREEPPVVDEVVTPEAAAFLTDAPLQIDAARGARRPTGTRIDLDFKDIDIHNILRFVSEIGGVNIVTTDDVTGSITIRMRNVPWDQALEVILQAKGLGMVRRGNLIRVAPLMALEKEREAAIARQAQSEKLAPVETRLISVSYATATALEARIRDILSGRGKVSVDERTNMLIVRDILENLDNVEDLVRSLDTPTPQVLIEARIVEATSRYTRAVGIQWGGDISMSTATGNPTGLPFPSSFATAGGASSGGDTPTAGLSPFSTAVPLPNFVVNMPAAAGVGEGGALGLALGSLGGNVNLNVRLSAMESSGTVRIVSAPRILTLDNHEAAISQGTMIPYSQVSAQGVQTSFQNARLSLTVKPHVTADGSVSMAVSVNRDEPDFGNRSARGDPTILQREASTELLVPDGHTAVIGGIYTRNTSRNHAAVPFFADIPILGVLFQTRQVRDDRNELLIFLTPRIVNRDEALRQ